MYIGSIVINICCSACLTIAAQSLTPLYILRIWAKIPEIPDAVSFKCAVLLGNRMLTEMDR